MATRSTTYHGAPGIGSKGAVQIIQQFGSIDSALEHWEDVKHKTYRESLRDNADLIRQSRELARIKVDLDIELDLDLIKSRPPDRAAAYELFRELEFANLTREFADAAAQVSAPGPSTLQYSIVRTSADLERLTKSLWDAEGVGVGVSDPTPTETTDQQCLGYDLAAGIAVSTAPGVSVYVDLENFPEGQAVR